MDDDEFARDSLHLLPLSSIPLESRGLQRSRLRKNVRIQNVIEIFNESGTGSGQVRPEDIPVHFDGEPSETERDHKKIEKICTASSFDVFSLRIELRRMKIDVNNHSDLSLSDRKKAELTEYMKVFTRPLVQQIYGSSANDISDVSDIIGMFANPNREEALRNLKSLAELLRIELSEIPAFLEEYGDIFLSLAYFRKCIDDLVPDIDRFLAWLRECQESRDVHADIRLSRLLQDIGNDITNITASITGRFESFDRRSRDFWNDINADTFRNIRSLIAAHHVTIGGVLCGLTVKMDLWKQRFGRGGGGPHRRIEFIKSEILPGLDHIKKLEESAGSIPQ